MQGESRIILALDVYDEEKAMEIVRQISDEIFSVKINWPLILGAGVGIVKKISSVTKVICDLKIADIPNTNRLITNKIRENGAYGIISHSFVGRDSLQAVLNEAREMKVFSVVAMSNPGSKEVMDQHIDDLLRMSLESNVYGFVAPGNKIDLLRKIRSAVGEKKIISPGIGAQGGDAAQALLNGSDYVIIGRTIYQSRNPLETVKELNETISRALSKQS